MCVRVCVFLSWHCDEEADLWVECDSDGEWALSGDCSPDGLHLGRDSWPPDQRSGEEDSPAQPVLAELPAAEQPHGRGKTPQMAGLLPCFSFWLLSWLRPFWNMSDRRWTRRMRLMPLTLTNCAWWTCALPGPPLTGISPLGCTTVIKRHLCWRETSPLKRWRVWGSTHSCRPRSSNALLQTTLPPQPRLHQLCPQSVEQKKVKMKVRK